MGGLPLHSDVGERCFIQNKLTGVEKSRLAVDNKVSVIALLVGDVMPKCWKVLHGLRPCSRL